MLHTRNYKLYIRSSRCHDTLLIPKDEFKIEPRYAHTKKLRQIREKSYGGPKLIDENNFTIKKHKKTENFQISMLYDDPFPRHDFFLWFV